MQGAIQHRRFALIGILLALIIALVGKTLSLDQMRFLLDPTAAMLSLTGVLQSTWEPGLGYVTDGIRIEKSCSGFNFLALALGLFCFQLLTLPVRNRLSWILPGLLSVWVLTIIANSWRISSAIALLDMAEQFPILSEPGFHQVVGVFSTLLCLYLYQMLLRGLAFRTGAETRTNPQ